MIKTICVAGAGTMGSGIALAAAQYGFALTVFDPDKGALQRSAAAIQHSIRQLTDRKKITVEAGENIFKSIHLTNNIHDCIADLFIEAIVENAEAKISLFNQLTALNNQQAIFATNTSSLSVSAIQQSIANPERVIGMHFFNPAHIMKLVEVISGKQTGSTTVFTVIELCKAIGKIPVHCNDSPGFIVNRVARPYYLEAMKIASSGIAKFEDIDAIMEASGFKMGPFKLMDLIGIDINLAASKSIYEALGRVERLAPSPLQKEKAGQGKLGRKTGNGFYNYSTD